ncbi:MULTISPECIES: VWA domain-containing protein [Haloferax]|uniref:VWA domain-containing protein n=2 Tax=Haloferax TaxID=2251 RepID=A0A6G1Z7S1_9EURY|nr:MULTISPECIES: VWA domain-containing protein [Haloferax]KAB1184833.1 VWA domain-containing protein [Haloferax sp. CBA1149]MRW82468.1 VWA domain-containing protein [Haloferax marinisediminis]
MGNEDNRVSIVGERGGVMDSVTIKAGGGKLQDGEQITLIGEFVSQRTVHVDRETACRVSIRTDAETLYEVVLAPNDSGERLDLKVGSIYTIEGTVATAQTSLPYHETSCPECNGALRESATIDEYENLVSVSDALNLGGCFIVCDSIQSVNTASTELKDDWIPKETRTPARINSDYICVDCENVVPERELEFSRSDTNQPTLNACAAPANESLGLATGGARDASNFRENIAEGYAPQPDALSYEGLFYDYQFPTAESESTSDALFTPTFERAAGDNPVTGEREQFLSVGLDSTLNASEFERPALDLVAVLDISGSMSSPFDEYYYDANGTRKSTEATDPEQTKLNAATESLCALTRHLNNSDRFGVVLYNSDSHVAKPLSEVRTTDMGAIRGHIREVVAGGGTNMETGFTAARELLSGGDTNREQRVIFMTDAMPNVGETRSAPLVECATDASKEGIYTTFVGMGLDENAALMSKLSGIRGANHYFIHSASEFKTRLADEFDYMVSPLVFDLSLSIETDGCDVDAVYGAPNADISNGQILSIETLFPSPTTAGESRGGVILVRLHQLETEQPNVTLDLSWVESDSTTHGSRVTVDLPTDQHYDNRRIRKAVALSRYGRTLREWATSVRQSSKSADAGVDDWMARRETRTKHERESAPLRVSDSYAAVFDDLRDYLATESKTVDDDSMTREIAVIDDLLTHTDRKRPSR